MRSELASEAWRGRVRQRRREGLASIFRDVRLALRIARRSPGSSLITIRVFGLGIGLTTTMFSLVDNVLVRPLALSEPDQLVGLWSVAENGSDFPWVSSANWLDWKEQNSTLSGTAIHASTRVAVATDADAFRVQGESVAGPFFEVLGLPFRVGRPFSEEEAQEGAALAVVSEGFWRRVMGAEPDLASRPLAMNGNTVQVVGVVAGDGVYPADTEVWLPQPIRRQSGAARNNINWFTVARLRLGVSIEEADRDLDRVAQQIRQTEPAGIYSWGVAVHPLQDVVVGEDAPRYLGVLMGAVLLVLLIACANLAGLNLARTESRGNELGIRLALGAGRARLVRQLVTEQVVLALVGAVFGCALSLGLIRWIVNSASGSVPRIHEVGLDGRALAFAIVASALSGLLASLLPAWKATGRYGSARTSRSGRGAVRGGRGLPGHALIASEVALAVLLLSGAGLLLRSYQSVLSRDLGFDAANVVMASVALDAPEYREEPDRAVGYWDQVLDAVRTIQGVDDVAVANAPPTGLGGTGFIELEGRPDETAGAGYRVVSPGYFRTLGIPLLSGRALEATDGPGNERVVVVNRTYADYYWPDQEVIGTQVRAISMEGWFNEGEAPWLRVVGVVEDIRHDGHESDPEGEMYVSFRQVPPLATAMTAVVRVRAGSIQNLTGTLREAVRGVDPSQAVDMDRLDQQVAGQLALRRLILSILGGFAGLALTLAALGIFGLLSFSVAQRRREIGVRAALGAESSRILRLVLRNAMTVVAMGVGIGMLAAVFATRIMSALLVEVNAGDPLTLVAAATVLLAVSLLAAFLPSWRASRIEPLEALREV